MGHHPSCLSASHVSFGEGDSTPLQCSCLENPRDGGAWWAAVHGVTKSWTRLSDFTFTFHFHALEKEMATHSCSCLENPRDGGAWWAAVYGVAQGWTRLKRRSSSSSVSAWPARHPSTVQVELPLCLVFSSHTSYRGKSDR